MVYPPDFDGQGVMEYYKNYYGIDIAETRLENLDEPDTVQIVPAGWGPDWYPISPDTQYCIQANCPNAFHSTKIMYWLGWTVWQHWEIKLDVEPDLTHKNLQKVYHACQSQRTYDLLMNSGCIKPERIFFLREHTVDTFMHSDEELRTTLDKRKNLVLFNPVKGPENARSLMKVCRDLNCTFIPVTGMSHQQMVDLGMQSKVYIDFGPFPGREKIHREMAVCGCSIITGSDGSANNPIDVPSGPRKFFRMGGHYDWIAVKKQIKWDLENHEQAFDDFHMQHYRESVRAEKPRFENDVDNMLATIKIYGNLVD